MLISVPGAANGEPVISIVLPPVLSVRSPAKQEEESFGSPNRKSRAAFDQKAKGKKTKYCAKSTRNVPQIARYGK